MKIKLTTCLAGVDHVWNPGDEVEVEAAEGRRLVEAGFAVPVASRAAEKAAASKPAAETR
jgi:hypothetical protein